MSLPPEQGEPLRAAYEARQGGLVVGHLVIARTGRMYAATTLKEPGRWRWERVDEPPWPPDCLVQL